jgi:hypothetical protein
MSTDRGEPAAEGNDGRARGRRRRRAPAAQGTIRSRMESLSPESADARRLERISGHRRFADDHGSPQSPSARGCAVQDLINKHERGSASLGQESYRPCRARGARSREGRAEWSVSKGRSLSWREARPGSAPPRQNGLPGTGPASSSVTATSRERGDRERNRGGGGRRHAVRVRHFAGAGV